MQDHHEAIARSHSVIFNQITVGPNRTRMELSSQSVWGTGAFIKCQTSMNQHHKSKQFNGGAGSQLRGTTGSRTTHHPLQQQSSRTRRPRRLFQSTRDLMICLGWLRLFQTIVSPGPIQAAHKTFSSEF